MTGLEIAALVSMVGGAYMKHQAQNDALKRQQQVIQEGLARQREHQMAAEQTAMKAAQEFAPEQRIEQQQQIADQTATTLAAPVSDSQEIRAQQQETQGETSDAYKTAKTKSDLQALQSAQALAKLLGRTSSAGRLRMNEAISLMDAGQKIDQVGSFSRGDQAANSIKMQAAGQADPSMQFWGSILQGAGSAGLSMGSAPAGAGAGDGLTATGTADYSLGDGLASGFDLGGTGLRSNAAKLKGMRIFG